MRQLGRWSLSPAYDLNPVPEIDLVRMSKTPIAEDMDEGSISSALDIAPRFGLSLAQSKEILQEIFVVVTGWRKTGRQLQIKNSTLDAYASAFQHPIMKDAKRSLASK